MSKLITATGKELDCGYLVTIPSPKLAYIRVRTDFLTAARIFTDPEETRALTLDDRTICGYTQRPSITDEGELLLISLEKED